MARTFGWRSAALAALLGAAALACEEKVAAPGRCPELCGGDTVQVYDTVITGVVYGDTSISGYTRMDQLPILVAGDNGLLQARVLVRFVPVPHRWFPIPNDTVGVRIGTIDSVTVDLRLDTRDTAAKNLRARLFSMPGDSLDSTQTWSSAQHFFTFGNFRDSIPVDDSLQVASLHRCWAQTASASCGSLGLIAPWIPDTVDADTLTPGLGVNATANGPTVAVFAATDFTAVPPRLKYYVHGRAPQDTFHTVFDLTPTFDTYVAFPKAAAIPPQTIVLGNQPAARAFASFRIPSYYVDTAFVLRATLIMTPTQAPTGFPRATFGIEAHPLLRFFGGKSLVIQDTTVAGRGTVTVGSNADVTVEVGPILRAWRGTNPDSLPRAVSLRLTNEAFEIGELRAAGSGGGAAAPRLEITFVRPLKFGVP